MRAKSFFYVCLGILAIALAYHLGASRAAAQGSGPYEVGEVDVDGSLHAAVVSGRTVHGWRSGLFFTTDPVPGTASIIAVDQGAEDLMAMTADGSTWFWRNSTSGPWHLLVVLPGGSTPAQRESIGQVKARYR